MRDFYHPTVREQGQDAAPHILGLTASPIIRSKLSELQFVSTLRLMTLLINSEPLKQISIQSAKRPANNDKSC
jgi:hypothetical protein